MQEHSLSERVPFWHFDQDVMIFWDGSLGAGFELEGVDINCASADGINHIATQLENLLKGMSEGIRLQVYYRLTDNAKSMIDRHGAISQNADAKHQMLRKARLEHLGKMTWFIPKIYFFIRSTPHAKGKRFAPLLQKDLK